MKIIDLAICINNNDPQGLGRIRCIKYSSYTSEYERAFKYKEWDDNDLFTANPFLPNNINFIPEVGQSVKIINYDPDKETVNVEYIAGPFTTRHDYNSQIYSEQIEKTTYGAATKKNKDVIDKNGEYINPKSKGAFAKHTDYGVYGKSGSDIIFTEDGIQMRGGKLKTKESSKNKEKVDMLYQPIMSNKIATLSLKKFPYVMEFKDEPRTINVLPASKLNYIVEYSIDSFTGSEINIDFFVYHITKTYGDSYKTNNPLLNEVPFIDGHYKLINLDDSLTGATISKTATSINGVATVIRDVLSTLHYKNLNEFNVRYPKSDLHPFYFRPTIECNERTLNTTTEDNNRNLIFKGVTINNISGPKNGLAFNINQLLPKNTTLVINDKILKVNKNKIEQTFSSLKSDKIYLLSTDPKNVTKTPINFETLNKYEITQDEYLNEIDPHTFSTVRGEVLLQLLKKMYEVLLTHCHNLNSPYVKNGFDAHTELENLFKTIDDDILNKCIKIN
jgi:hypothetical protein